MKHFIIAVLIIGLFIMAVSCSSNPIQKGDKGFCNNVSVGYTPSISKNTGDVWGTQIESLFTYTGILDGSFVITLVVWQNMGSTTTRPIMYVPCTQTSFTIWNNAHWVHITNIIIGQESSISFNWEVQ